jgi:hypothetical protein
MGKFKNISLRVFRNYLIFCGLNHIRTKGGHEVWSAKGLTRPVILQTHIDPIPEFIIKNNIRTMGRTEDDFLSFLSKK